jgi:hypothetical protein
MAAHKKMSAQFQQSQRPVKKAKYRHANPILTMDQVVQEIHRVRFMSVHELRTHVPFIWDYVDWFMNQAPNDFPCFNSCLALYALDKFYDRIDKKHWLSNLIFPEMNDEHVIQFIKLVLPSSDPEMLIQHKEAVMFDENRLRPTSTYRWKWFRGQTELQNPNFISLLHLLLEFIPESTCIVMQAYDADWLEPKLQPVLLHAMKLGYDVLDHKFKCPRSPCPCKANLLEYAHNKPDLSFNDWKKSIDFALDKLQIPIDHIGSYGRTAIFCQHRYPERMAYLIKRGADVIVQDFLGNTVLMDILDARVQVINDLNQLAPEYKKTIELLIKTNSSLLDIPNYLGHTPLNVILKTPYMDAFEEQPNYRLQSQWIKMVNGIMTPILLQHSARVLNPVFVFPPELHHRVVDYLLPSQVPM